MRPQKPIEVKGSIERNGVEYGCVRRNLDSASWSFIPAGRYSKRAFDRACKFFDGKRDEITETYVTSEQSYDSGATVTRLATSEMGQAALAGVTDKFFGRRFYGYEPLEK